MKSSKLIESSLAAAIPVLAFIIQTSEAAVYQLNHPFSDGAVPPAGSLPWLTFTTTDLGANQVQLDFEATNLSGTEYISEWYFNLAPGLDPSQLVFSSPVQVGTFSLPLAIDRATDAYKPDGDGRYDVRLTFDETNSGLIRFAAGDKLSYTVSYTGGSISAASFDFLSAPEGGSGPFYSAAHVNSTGVGGLGSAYIAAVPEPSTAVYGVVAALAVLAGGRHRRRPAD